MLFFVEKGKIFDCSLIFHNSGTIGDITQKAEELKSEKDWHDYLQINLVSTILLNNLVLQILDNKVQSLTSIFHRLYFLQNLKQLELSSLSKELFV